MSTSKKIPLLSMTILALCVAHVSGCATNTISRANSAVTTVNPTYSVARKNPQEGSSGNAVAAGTPGVSKEAKTGTQTTNMDEKLRRQEEELERQRRELEELQKSPRESYSAQEQEQMQEDDRLFDERGEDFARPY